MKTVFKKVLAFMLATAVVFSCAAAGLEAMAFESEGSLEISTRIFSQNGENLIETETVQNGETVTVRVYVGTDYPTNAGELMFFYNTDFFRDGYARDQLIDIKENEYYKQLVGLDASGVFYSADSKAAQRLVGNGIVTEDFLQKHQMIAVNYMFSPTVKNTALSADEWFVEFELEVKADAEAGEGRVYVVLSTVQSPDNPYGYISVPVGEEDKYVEDTRTFGDVYVDVTIDDTPVINYGVYTFDPNGGMLNGSADKAEYNVVFGDGFDTDSLVPVKEGHRFAGWVETSEPNAQDKSFVAEWSANRYTVTFNTNGGNAIPSETYDFGEEILLPTPEKTGYKFVGWSAGAMIYTEGKTFTVPAKNVTLTAMWLVNSRSVKYRVGSEVFSFSATVGQAVPVPDLSGYEAIEILYWVDENGAETDIPDVMPDNDLVFTAVVKYNHVTESGVTATFDNGTFGENENGITFEAALKPTAQGTTVIGGKTYKQILNYDIGFKNGSTEIEPENGAVEISIPVPSEFAGRTDLVVARLGSNGTYEKVNAVIKNGKLVFSSAEFGEFAVFIKSETSIKTLPAKLSYNYKDSLDISGLELEVTDENGNKKTVSDTSKMKVSGYNPKKVGTQTVTVEFEGAAVTFDVTVSYAWWQMIIRILLLGFLWY